MTTTAKLFRNGASQAVRLPQEFRFTGDEVCIKRVGPAVLLFARQDAWKLMRSTLGQVDDDFMPQRQQPDPQPERQPR